MNNSKSDSVLKPAKKLGALILTTLVVIGGLSLAGCKGNGSGGHGSVDGGVTINGTMTNCFGDSVFLYELVGNDAHKIATAPLTKEKQTSTFTLSVKVPHNGFYQLGTGPRSASIVILGPDEEITFTGDCFDMAKTAKVDNSPANQGYAFLSAKVSRKNNEANQVVQNIRTFSVTNPQMVPQLQNDLVRIQEEKSRFLDSVITAGGYLGKIASLLRFKPFDGNMLARYGNESNYFLRTFFNGIDLKDSEMAYIPQFGDRFRQFVFNLVQQQQPADSISKYVNQTFSQIDPQSSSYMVALSAVIQGLDQAQSDLFLPYAEEFLQKYPKPTSFTQNLQVRVEAIRRFAVGATPPEISLPDQNGNILTLSSLKGKYVMIDFWASWCRPCRAENPNVVRLYKQYHNKGFEVLGVSLDKEKNAWMAAIQQDGLVWKHVSDLQFWQSRAAQDYGVNSIPMTFLLDKEGKIIGKNLRGPALEEKLKELFNS